MSPASHMWSWCSEMEVVGMRAPLLVDLSHSFVQKPLVLPEPLRRSDPLPESPLENIHLAGVFVSVGCESREVVLGIDSRRTWQSTGP